MKEEFVIQIRSEDPEKIKEIQLKLQGCNLEFQIYHRKKIVSTKIHEGLL